ncbi:MAG: KEOPS complex N(6)-L-threonylcarbamoyladenine synthase Kae1 [Candidatus Aenigmatarchaeota archaeon]
MLCLGLESTAHTFGAGVVSDKGDILANVRDCYVPAQGKGIIPRDAAAHHSDVSGQVVEQALKEAKTGLADIDLIAYARGPGIPPCLRVGAAVARALALKHEKPLVDVNHPVAHIEIGKLMTGAKDPVIIYVSGGNTQVLALVEGRYRVFGETLDIPVGNALDQFAREAGLGFPGGPAIEIAAKGGKYIELPYVVKGMDLSFAGIVSEVQRKMKAGAGITDLAFSLQETVFAMLVEVTERAVAHTDKKEVLVVGGVAANKRFAEMLDIMCRERGAKAFATPLEYSGDQGTMVAWTGLLVYRSKSYDRKKAMNAMIDPRWRADEVEVTWS